MLFTRKMRIIFFGKRQSHPRFVFMTAVCYNLRIVTESLG